VECTPRHMLDKPSLTPILTLSLALCTPAGSCPPKPSRNSAA
jgi:hypothetical protein